LKIFDVHGNDYRFFKIEGTHNIITKKHDLKELPAGVYFVSFNGKDFSEAGKLLFNKREAFEVLKTSKALFSKSSVGSSILKDSILFFSLNLYINLL